MSGYPESCRQAGLAANPLTCIRVVHAASWEAGAVIQEEGDDH